MVSKYSNVMKFYMYLATNDVSYTATELRQYHERQHELITLDSRHFYIKHSRRSQSDKQLAIWYYTRGFGTTPDRPRRTSHSETANDIGVGSIGVVNKSKTDMRREWAARAKW